MDFGRPNRPADPRLRHPALAPGKAAPLELRMELLVDGELPEAERRAFLRELDAAGDARWRDLAIRFLERQTEKETARTLMAGGRLIPMDALPQAGFWNRAFGWRTVTATAAGLLVVASAALVVITFYPSGHKTTQQTAQYNVLLPADTVGDSTGGAVMVPLVKGATGNEVLFPRDTADDSRMIKRTWIIDPVKDGAVTVPVDTLKATYN